MSRHREQHESVLLPGEQRVSLRRRGPIASSLVLIDRPPEPSPFKPITALGREIGRLARLYARGRS